ncbi:sigma-70 family RNA polymerase sigma factor [Tsukamurella soli]|uniref:Sigma-70 family RNA polymerase sigma factor n=1 Tax=Tsukamurella soli TaxID=644556 RepID=A0ABP8KC72_9ACTN
MDTTDIARFEANRDRLGALAYRLLGSAADAEDVVQDAFLRWEHADRARVDVPEAWLTKVVTNLAVDRLRSARVRHERAVGAWLPEPLLGGDPMLGPAETVEQRESVTLAVLLLMERLTPTERAVYVLREAFGHRHREIAEILDITESASQQHALRARRHLASDRRGSRVDDAAARRIVEEFVDAAVSGRTDRLLEMLTDDVSAVSDGAGLARRLLQYAAPERVATMVRAGFAPTPAKRRIAGGVPAIHVGSVNGSPAAIATVGDRVVGVVVLCLRGERVATVFGVGALARLGRLDAGWRLDEHDAPFIPAW